jgi:hypothetical protein
MLQLYRITKNSGKCDKPRYSNHVYRLLFIITGKNGYEIYNIHHSFLVILYNYRLFSFTVASILSRVCVTTDGVLDC